jgi:hypothetical protein
VNLFLKIKAEASGYPPWVSNDADRERYVESFLSSSGIRLNRNAIEHNPALRSIAKICLNSFWGKLGERNNKPKTHFFSNWGEVKKIRDNSANEIKAFQIITEDIAVLEYVKQEAFEEDNGVTNEIIASFTACLARLELLKHLKSVGRRALYCDTDSVIFLTKREAETGLCDVSPPLGDNLGELTRELPSDTHITKFVTTAPKSYAYICSDGTETVKFKGVTLNYRNRIRLNYNSVLELLLNKKSKIKLYPGIQFLRNKYSGEVFTAQLNKTATCTYDKRVVKNNFVTIPYGFREQDDDDDDGDGNTDNDE